MLTTNATVVIAANKARGDDYNYIYWQFANDEFFGVSGALAGDLASGIVPLIHPADDDTGERSIATN